MHTIKILLQQKVVAQKQHDYKNLFNMDSWDKFMETTHTLTSVRSATHLANCSAEKPILPWKQQMFKWTTKSM